MSEVPRPYRRPLAVSVRRNGSCCPGPGIAGLPYRWDRPVPVRPGRLPSVAIRFALAGSPGSGMWISTANPAASSQPASNSVTARLPWSIAGSTQLTEGAPISALIMSISEGGVVILCTVCVRKADYSAPDRMRGGCRERSAPVRDDNQLRFACVDESAEWLGFCVDIALQVIDTHIAQFSGNREGLNVFGDGLFA